MSLRSNTVISEEGGSHNDYLQTQPPALLTPTQTARALGVSKRTLNNWTRQKRIPVMRPTIRTTRYHLGRVLKALEKFELKEVS